MVRLNIHPVRRIHEIHNEARSSKTWNLMLHKSCCLRMLYIPLIPKYCTVPRRWEDTNRGKSNQICYICTQGSSEVLQLHDCNVGIKTSVIQKCMTTLLNRTHFLFKGGHFSYHWLCSASWCDAPWRPWWCHSGKRRALMERSHWPSSSCCTPDIDKRSNEKLEMVKEREKKQNCMTSVKTYMATMASPRAVVAVTTGFLMFLFMWPEWDF